MRVIGSSRKPVPRRGLMLPTYGRQRPGVRSDRYAPPPAHDRFRCLGSDVVTAEQLAPEADRTCRLAVEHVQRVMESADSVPSLKEVKRVLSAAQRDLRDVKRRLTEEERELKLQRSKSEGRSPVKVRCSGCSSAVGNEAHYPTAGHLSDSLLPEKRPLPSRHTET
jgi:hypothetical protein